MKPAQPIVLHGFKKSGHSHRAELMLRLLALPFEFRAVDLAGGEQRGAAFLELNPFGTVPVLEDEGVAIADSAALYSYVAHAPEGGVSLEPYGEIRAWLTRIEALPGFAAMPRTKAGLAA